LLETSRETENFISLKPVLTHPYSPIMAFQRDNDEMTKSPLFDKGHTTFTVIIYDNGPALAISKKTLYNGMPFWNEDRVSMEVDLWGPGVGNKLNAKLVCTVNGDLKGETVCDIQFLWRDFVDYIARSDKWE